MFFGSLSNEIIVLSSIKPNIIDALPHLLKASKMQVN